MRESLRRAASLLVLAGCLFGCKDGPCILCGDGVPCTAEVRIGLSLLVHDAATGAPAAEGASGEMHVNGRSVALEVHDFWRAPAERAVMIGHELYEEAGVYSVVVRKPGYDDWTAAGIRVEMEKSGCHVQPVTVRADLVPLPLSIPVPHEVP